MVTSQPEYGAGVLANRADLASVELPFLSIGELPVGPEPMSGCSASPTDAFSWRNELPRSLSSRSCSCSSWSGVTTGSGSGRCGAPCLGQLSLELGDSLAEHCYVFLFLQLRKLFLQLRNLFLEHVGLLVLFWLRYFPNIALPSASYAHSLDTANILQLCLCHTHCLIKSYF